MYACDFKWPGSANIAVVFNRGEIADWVLKNYPDHDLSKFYPEAVNSDSQYGLGIGLGGTEAQEKYARYRNK